MAKKIEDQYNKFIRYVSGRQINLNEKNMSASRSSLVILDIPRKLPESKRAPVEPIVCDDDDEFDEWITAAKQQKWTPPEPTKATRQPAQVGRSVFTKK